MGEQAKIVTFSGIDGAGKSTQIQALTLWLHSSGLTVRSLSFWDDVVMFARLREGMSGRIFKGDPGIGSPDKPVNRRDKNVRSRPVTGVRFFLYFLDALNTWRKVHSEKNSQADVVIFDRYIYDELANLPLRRRFTQIAISVLSRIIPKPDIAYVIDAEPLAARQRKPEYPLEFIRENREAYLTLSRLITGIQVIGPLPVESTEQRVKEVFAEYFCSEPGNHKTASHAVTDSAR